MSLGEGHLTHIPAQKLGPGLWLPGTRYRWCTLMDGWRELAWLAWSLIPWQVVEVVVTSNSDINAQWVCLDSHCHVPLPYPAQP